MKEFVESESVHMNREIFNFFINSTLESMRYGLNPYKTRDPEGNLIIDVIVDQFEFRMAINMILDCDLSITKNRALRLATSFDKSLNVENYYPGMIDDTKFLYNITMKIEGITKKDIQFWDQMMLRWEERYRYIKRIFNQSQHELISRL